MLLPCHACAALFSLAALACPLPHLDSLKRVLIKEVGLGDVEGLVRRTCVNLGGGELREGEQDAMSRRMWLPYKLPVLHTLLRNQSNAKHGMAAAAGCGGSGHVGNRPRTAKRCLWDRSCVLCRHACTLLTVSMS